MRQVWHGRQWQHARHVAWALSPRPSALLAAAGTAKNLLLRRAEGVRVSRYAGRWFCVLDNRRPPRARARRYFSPLLGVDGFLGALTDAGVAYVVLRWFDALPDVAPDEDIDLLVADADLPAVEALLDRLPGTLPCDVYTVSGLPGTEFSGTAYLPPVLAEQVLARRRLWGGRYGAPSAEDALLCLAYHAVYSKGDASGLPPSATEPPAARALREGHHREHDYGAALREHAEALGVSLDGTLEGLDEFLDKRGWRPPSDMLARRAVANDWLRRRLAAERANADQDSPGLAVFFLRQRAVDLGLVDGLLDDLVREGFTVLEVRSLDNGDRERVRRLVRGGNWGRGPWPVSGGDPAVVVVALDLVPLAPTPQMLRRFPALSNARLLVKEQLRAKANAALPAAEHANVLHGSDNGREAVSYVRIALPDDAERLLAEAQRHRVAFRTTEFPVLADLTADVDHGRLGRAGAPHGRRAKVELVDVAGRLGVKKTYKPGCERFLERERLAAEQFAPRDPHFLPLLAKGDNYLVWPYVEDTLHSSRHSSRRSGRYASMLPLPVAREALAALRFVWEQGYAVLDARPDNLLVDRDGRVYLIDLEFLHRYSTRPARFEESYDIVGVPSEVATDAPKEPRRTYERNWAPRVGLGLEELLEAPRWRQAVLRGRHRVVVVLPWAARRQVGRASRQLRQFAVPRLRRGRLARRLLD